MKTQERLSKSNTKDFNFHPTSSRHDVVTKLMDKNEKVKTDQSKYNKKNGVQGILMLFLLMYAPLYQPQEASLSFLV